VLERSIAQCAQWRREGRDLSVAVNLSVRNLLDRGLPREIERLLSAHGLPPEALQLEITESMLMADPERALATVTRISALGVRFAVDDFGTGYSSLAYLRQFPVDCLKIDRMFTNAITTSPESKALVGTLVQLGKDLGLSTLAEGVETPEEMDLLRGAEVNQAQGFLMARPLDPDTLEAQLLAPTRPATPTTSRT
jgi:EAL domain-containing protein (putative c-di-GMP-specific phosphodiesterase class I)